MPYRVAVYYVPAPQDPLWSACCAWLGRDPERGQPCVQPPVENIKNLTSNPRRYGPHATLKPPMRLRGSYRDFFEHVQSFAADLSDFAMPQFAVVRLKTFLALCPLTPSAPLNALADRCVIELDRHRLPEAEILRAERAIGRSPAELENLARWGYPLVLGNWTFHITLSNAGAIDLLQSAKTFFAPAIAEPRNFGTLAIFCEDEPGADFRLAARVGLGR